MAITNSPVIADVLGEADRSGLKRIWVREVFETVGSEGAAHTVCLKQRPEVELTGYGKRTLL